MTAISICEIFQRLRAALHRSSRRVLMPSPERHDEPADAIVRPGPENETDGIRTRNIRIDRAKVNPLNLNKSNRRYRKRGFARPTLRTLTLRFEPCRSSATFPLDDMAETA